MMWTIADTHFGSGFIHDFCLRSFQTAKEHDDYLISQINKYVKKDDTLILVGDFCDVNPAAYCARIHCKNLHMVFGNHDLREHAICFGTVQTELILTLKNGVDCYFHHYPNAYWPDSHHGSYHVYGHVHDLREGFLDLIFKDRRATDVGVDTARRLLGEYRPFSEDDLINLLQPKLGHDRLLFYKESDEIRKKHSVNLKGEVVPFCRDLDHRPITLPEYFKWQNTHPSY